MRRATRFTWAGKLVVGQRQLADCLPLLITHPVESDRIWAMSEEAALTGVKIGMALHQARQILPAAVVVEPDETGGNLPGPAAPGRFA
jgi:hypothetical protein